MISEITVQDSLITDSAADCFLAKIALNCFIGQFPKVVEVLVQSPWTDIKYYKITIKSLKVLGNNEDLEINSEEEENLKKAVAAFLVTKIK